MAVKFFSGLCYSLPLAQFRFDMNSVFIGIHVDMPSKISDDDNTSKYATIGLSFNNSGGSFLKQSGNFFVQSLEHDEIETVIEEMIEEVLNRFENGFSPTRIIVYRSGSGSEDEIQSLLMKEVSVIRRTVSYSFVDAPMTFITVTKENYLQDRKSVKLMNFIFKLLLVLN
uniref:Piwi domain-containing protein n=1 Tax=Panagrolaimus sp. PS1159 TaxID=55785 RepID=A0AC35GCP0_9BILA